jgi:O-antigen ligase
VVRSWLVIAAFSALIGVLAFNLPIPFRGSLLGDGGTRARAFFKDPNVYGPFLIPIAVIVLEERLRARTLRLRPSILGGLFVLLALGVVFSFSRAAAANLVLATVIMLGVHAARRRGARQAMRLLVGILLSLAVIAGILGATGSLGFLQQRAQLQSYDTNRFGAQHYGYELGWQYPVGVGPGQFKYHHPIETHSTYVRVLAEQGFLGLAAWIALALTTLVLALSNAVAGRDTYGIGSAALLGSWCGLLFNSAVVDTLHWRHLWIVGGLIWAGTMRSSSA